MTAAQQLEACIARYAPDVARCARAALAVMRKRLPGTLELVYDNYNALAIAFGPTERVSDVIFSIALYPRWVSLFFAHGAGLPDPTGRLAGKGSRIRHVVLDDASTLDEPEVRALMAAALKQARPVPKQPRRIIIKSVSPKQRPRRPAATVTASPRPARPRSGRPASRPRRG